MAISKGLERGCTKHYSLLDLCYISFFFFTAKDTDLKENTLFQAHVKYLATAPLGPVLLTVNNNVVKDL